MGRIDSSSDSDDSDELPKRKLIKKDKNKWDDKWSGKNCDNDQKNGEICAICLCNMDTDIGSPDMCDHLFCLECILEWAKTNNSCPKDRITFLQVFVRKKIGGKIIRVIPIEEVKPDDVPEEELDDITFCEICRRSDREDTLLLCDECDSGYHLDCLTPNLESVPVDEWFCPECVNIGAAANRADDHIDFNEVDRLINDGASIIRDLPARRRAHSPRVLPRTRGSERVRARIVRARISRAANNRSFSEELLNEESPVSNMPIASTSGASRNAIIIPKKCTKKRVVRRKTVKKRKPGVKKRKLGVKKRKSTKGTTKKKRKVKTTKKRTRKGKVRRSAKRTGGRRKRLKRLWKKRTLNALSTPKSRIAEVLGITSKKHPGKVSMPYIKAKENFSTNIGSIRLQKFNAGLPSLSLLGSNFELEYVPEGEMDTDDGLSVMGVRRNLAQTESLMARKKAAAILRTAPSARRQMTDFSNSPSVDILDSIIENQSNLLQRKSIYGGWSEQKVKPSETKTGIKQCANGESGSLQGQSQQRFNSQESTSSSHGSDLPNQDDPTGSEAYSSYLRERGNSETSTDYQPIKIVTESTKKSARNNKEKAEDDINLYSDVEPEAWDELESVSPSPERNDQEEEASTEDDLVIDDDANADRQASLSEKNGRCDMTALPGMREYDEFSLEQVSDTEVKSFNSSISLSDSNADDVEIIDSLESLKPVGMGLDGLEVETISDSEEICFEDENIEEGEIPCDIPSKLPLVRPRVNMQFKKPLEMIASSKEFDGDYEEGEIVDDAAAKRDKREKAKEEVDKIVNQPLDNEETLNNGDIISPVETTEMIVDTKSLQENESSSKVENGTDGDKETEKTVKDNQTEKKDEVSFKKISRNTKVRNYRETEKDSHGKRKQLKDRDKGKRKLSPDDRSQKQSNKKRRGRTKDKDKDRSKKGEPKRKEMERYNVRQMITKKEEERKKKDEFGRDVSLRHVRSRSRTPTRRRSSRSRRRSRSRCRSSSRKSKRKRRRSYSSSTSSSSTSSSSFCSSSTTSSSSSSSSSSPPRRDRRKTDTKIVKKVEKKKEIVTKRKEKPKVSLPPLDKKEKKKVNETDQTRIEKMRKRKKRDKTPLQSKEVFQSGGSIMVSVNFALNQAKESKKKKDKETIGKSRPSDLVDPNTFGWDTTAVESMAGKRTPLQDEPMWSPENINDANKGAISPMRDLDIIMVTPPPQEPILISDSDDEGITRLPLDLGAKQPSPQMRNQGPKTPPEPGVKFTLSMKQNLKSITNPLDDKQDRQLNIHGRGPNTPPGPPPESDESGGRVKSPLMPHSRGGTPINSSPEPDVYDPFEPTKSPSPQTSPPQSAREISKETIEVSDSQSKDASPSNNSECSPPPPLPSEPPELEKKPPEPQKLPEEESRVVINTAPPTTIVHPPTSTLFPINSNPLTQNIITKAPPLAPMQQIFAGLPANVASILYPAALAAAGSLLRPQILTPDLSRPPPSTSLLTTIPMVGHNNISKFIDKPKVNHNGKPAADFLDLELGSPTSPCSSEASDIFEPPSPHKHDKISPKKQRLAMTPQKRVEKFDALFGTSSRKSTPHKTTPVKFSAGKLAAELDAEIPSSAVELQIKEKFLKKIQRQERVVEEVKHCLKPFYNRKTINKDDYKEIMKKCVQKVCHNKSGEINPIRIRSLVEGYIKKVKYYRKKFGGSKSTMPPSVNDPPPPGFGTSKTGKIKP